MRTLRQTFWGAGLLVAAAALLATSPAAADQVINDDCIVIGSQCIGQDCVNGENFGFDTLRLKENNLRIKFDDTSSTASFPRNDWQLTANDTTNGGAEKFSIDDITNGRTPFTIRGNAPSNSIFVDTSGRVGFKTATPVVDLHVRNGNTPTLRLEQDGSSGFTPQTWDVAGNETNFFVRDASNGSQLPLRIRPSAPSNSIFVNTNGDVGLGTASPDADMHVLVNDSADVVHIQTTVTGATTKLLKLESASRPRLEINNNSVTNGIWNFDVLNGTGNFAFIKFSGPTFTFEADGDLVVPGEVYSATCTAQTAPCAPDYVFADDYELMPLDQLQVYLADNKHLPNVPSAEELSGSFSMSKMQMTLLEKVEELTLYTLQQQETIKALHQRLESLEKADEPVTQ